MKKNKNGNKYDGIISDKIDVKIFILFLLDNINDVMDYETIYEIVRDCGAIGSFDFAECFSQLEDLGHILTDTEDGIKYCRISDMGREIAHELQSGILEPIREKSSKIAAKFISLKERNATITATVTERDDGKYIVRCSMDESSGEIFGYDVCVSSRAAATKIKNYFESKPTDIYRAFMTVVTGDFDYFMK